MYQSFRDKLDEDNLVGKSVTIEYRLLAKEKIPDVLAIFMIKDKNEMFENSLPYFSVEKIIFDDGITIAHSYGYMKYVIISFLLFILWLFIGLINFIKKTWELAQVTPIDKPNKVIQENTQGKIIKKFSKCPACGMKLKETDNECPDCGLNFI